MPREHGLLFNAEMVRSILEGCKWQTRRPLALPKKWGDAVAYKDLDPSGFWRCHPTRTTAVWQYGDDRLQQQYHPGDTMWVREGFRLTGGGDNWQVLYRAEQDCHVSRLHQVYRIIYRQLRLDSLGRKNVPREKWERALGDSYCTNWRPSIHMPRWAARIVRTIIDVRFERVRDISRDDCEAEGSYWATDHDDEGGFVNLWNGLYGDRCPFDTGWCVVINFSSQ